MAFNNNSRSYNPNRSGNTNNQDDAWKASGFLNLYVPNRDGKRTKIGAIPLKEARPSEKMLLDWLKEDPRRVATIKEHLEIEFRTSEPTEGSMPAFI